MSTAPHLLVHTEKMVNLHFNLLNWPYLNFTHRCKSTTYLFSLRKVLVERHGRIKDLKICLNVFSEKTELPDEMRRIGDYIAEMQEEAERAQQAPAATASSSKGGGGSTPSRTVAKQNTMKRDDGGSASAARGGSSDPTTSAEYNSPFDEAGGSAKDDDGDKDEEEKGTKKGEDNNKKGTRDQELPGELQVKIYYDFKPFDAEDPNPILLNWNC